MTEPRWFGAPDDWWRLDEEGCLPAVLLGADTGPLPHPPGRAVLTTTALGTSYEVWINGARAGDEQLAPSRVDFARLVHSRDHDVTTLLRPGEPGRIRLLPAPGWYAGHNGDAPDGGWRRFRLRPHPYAELRRLTARHQTPHGRAHHRTPPCARGNSLAGPVASG